MKQVNAIIQPHMLIKVEHALHALPHFPGFTLLRAKGHARSPALAHAHHPMGWDLDEHDKIMLLILSSDELAPQIIEVIRLNAHTGLPGDGLIWVCDVSQVMRIRTDECNKDAV